MSLQGCDVPHHDGRVSDLHANPSLQSRERFSCRMLNDAIAVEEELTEREDIEAEAEVEVDDEGEAPLQGH
jgi:hypothetical protein